MGVGAGIGGGIYIGKIGIKAFLDAREKGLSFREGLSNFSNSFSGVDLGQQMVAGAVFGGIGKAAFLAADIHLAKAVLPESATLGQKVIAAGANTVTNKMREYTTTGGAVITANLMLGKQSTGLVFDSYNSQQEARRLNQQMNQQMLNQQFNQPRNFYLPQNQVKAFTFSSIKIQATDSTEMIRQAQMNNMVGYYNRW
ncbi:MULTISPECIES: hypothetical protein [Acinetobacter]|uniref:hypothetical protein n=1 Tax=Acinetobacter TaxID=469 RepID=UPI000AF9A427|nr:MULTISPECIES: hypothetical protein [Acinetobacter]